MDIKSWVEAIDLTIETCLYARDNDIDFYHDAIKVLFPECFTREPFCFYALKITERGEHICKNCIWFFILKKTCRGYGYRNLTDAINMFNEWRKILVGEYKELDFTILRKLGKI